MLAMRWDNLFDDLEGQLDAEIESAEHSVHEDEERHRQSKLTLHDRLRNLTLAHPSVSKNGTDNVDSEQDVITLTLTSGICLAISIMRHGSDWFAVDIVSPLALEGHAIIPIAGVAMVHPRASQVTAMLGVSVAGELGCLDLSTRPPRAVPRLADTLGLGFVLRDLARRRGTLEIHTVQGVFVGTLDRVGADHCDLAEHAPWAARREASVRSYRVLTLASIALIRIL